MGIPTKHDKAAKAAANCSEVKAKVADAVCILDKACFTLEFTCKDMDWEDEPCYDIRDAMRCAGLALAKLVEWEKEDVEDVL